MPHSPFRHRAIAPALFAGAFVMPLLAGCAAPPPSPLPAAQPLAAGQARLWFYRDFLAGDTMTAPAVALNSHTIAYAYPGTNFYRDVPPGNYLVTVESYGRDVGQSQQLALAPGEQEYVKIMSLPSWETGKRGYSRPTYYARAVPPRIADLEIPLTGYAGGN